MREELGRGRQVKKVIALRMALKIDGVEPLPEFQECVRVRKIAPLVKESLTEPFQIVVSVVSRLEEFRDLVAKFLQAQVVDGNTQYSEVVGKQFCFDQVYKRRHQLTFRQVSSGSEEHEYTRTSGFAGVLHVTIAVDCSRCCHDKDALSGPIDPELRSVSILGQGEPIFITRDLHPRF